MQRALDRFQSRTFDVLIIGGGITGACLAYDLVLRGLSVALLERGDFGAATSAASSKLLHGGIRYLQQLRLDKVRESAVERTRLRAMAPHLVVDVPFLVPAFRRLAQGRVALKAAFTLYDVLTWNAGASPEDLHGQRARYRSREEVAALAPVLAANRDLTGGFEFNEAHMVSSERMTLAFIKGAAAHGAAVANYVEVGELLRHGNRVVGALAIDRLGGGTIRVEARMVANAAGPWIPALNARIGPLHLQHDVLSYSKGVHIVTRPLLDRVAIALPTSHRTQAVVTRGGRHVFVIPWRGHSLIGTTSSPYAGKLEDVRPDDGDVRTLLDDVNAAVPGAGLARQDVRYAFAGLYPLITAAQAGVYQGTGEYQVVDHARAAGPEGLITVLGAKYTTARKVAEKAANLIAKRLDCRAPGRAAATRLPGGEIDSVPVFLSEVSAQYGAQLDRPRLEYLARHYGREIGAVLDSQRPSGLVPLAPDREPIEAEVHHAVEHEMAVRLDDVVFRRTGLGTLGHPGMPALRRAAGIMSRPLGWSEQRTNEEIADVCRRFELAAD